MKRRLVSAEDMSHVEAINMRPGTAKVGLQLSVARTLRHNHITQGIIKLKILKFSVFLAGARCVYLRRP